jgi:hypothetical protein
MPGTLQASGISECGHDRDAMNLQVGVGGSLSTEETLTAVAAELEALIAANQNTPLADRIEVRHLLTTREAQSSLGNVMLRITDVR